MTRWAELTLALYDVLGGWQQVANACAVNERVYSPGCYWNIAEGKTRKPTLAVRKAILAGLACTPACLSLAVNASLVQNGRSTVHIFYEDQAAGNLERIERGLTWPQVIHEWRKSHALMRREYDEGSEE